MFIFHQTFPSPRSSNICLNIIRRQLTLIGEIIGMACQWALIRYKALINTVFKINESILIFFYLCPVILHAPENYKYSSILFMHSLFLFNILNSWQICVKHSIQFKWRTKIYSIAKVSNNIKSRQLILTFYLAMLRR